MLEEFIAYLEDETARGSIYVLGAQGQRAPFSEAWLREREHGDETNINRDKALLEKRVKEGYKLTDIGAFDCSGLGMYWLQNVKKLYPGDLNANGMKGKCAKIARDKVRRGDWVFVVNDGGRATHIGFALDSDTAIECRGRDYGVVKTSVSLRPWNWFGRPELFRYEIEGYTVTRELKKGDKGEDVKALQHQLILHGFAMPKYGADGSFGSETHKSVCALQKSLKRPETGIAGKAEIEALHLVWKQEEQPGTDYEALYMQTKRELERTEAELVTLQAAYDELMDVVERARKILNSV